MTKKIPLTVSCLLFLLSILRFSNTMAQAEPNQAESLYKAASQLEDTKKYEDAKVVYQQIVQQCPNSPIVGNAAIHLSRFNTQAMIIAGNQAAADAEVNSISAKWANHPDLPWYLYVIAKQYEKLGRNDDAKSRYQKVIQQFPTTQAGKDARLHFSRFEVLSMITSGNQAAADAEISRITVDYQNHPDFPWFLYGIANRYEELKRNDEAKSIYQRILQQCPNSPVAGGARLHFSQYNVLSLITSGDDAAVQSEIASIKTGFSNHPDLPWYFLGIANQYDELKKRQEAKSIYQQILQQFTDTAFLPGTQVGFASYAKLQIARFDICSLIDSGNIEGADAAIAKMKTDFAPNPMLPDAIFRTTEMFYEKGLSQLHQETAPNNLLIKKSLALLENEVVPKATDKTLKVAVYYMMGLSYNKLGDYANAADAFKNAVEIATDPNNKHAGNMHWLWLRIADCYEKLKAAGDVNAPEADIVIETAYQDVAANYTNGGNLERALMRLGEINMEKHKYATACGYFQRFLAAADGNDPRIADIKSIVERYRSATDE